MDVLGKHRIYKYKRKKDFQAIQKRALIYLPILFILILILHTFFFFPLTYKGLGMELKQSKRYLYNKISMGLYIPFKGNRPNNRLFLKIPPRGSIVAFENPSTTKAGFLAQFFDIPVSLLTLGFVRLNSKKMSVKRILGLPGDSIKMIDKQIYINGKLFVAHWNIAFKDTRIFPADVSARDNMRETFIPNNHVFLLSDSWDIINDSRTFGPIGIHKVEGLLIH